MGSTLSIVIGTTNAFLSAALTPEELIGKQTVLTFWEGHNPSRNEQSLSHATTNTVADIVIYIDHKSKIQPDPTKGEQTWQGTFSRVLGVKPNLRDPKLEYWLLAFTPSSQVVDGKTLPKAAPAKTSTFEVEAFQTPEKKMKVVRDVIFYQNPSNGCWSASQNCVHDDVIQIFEMDSSTPPQSSGFRPKPYKQLMSLPTTIEVVRAYDSESPKIKKYLVRPVMTAAAQAS